MVLFDTKNTKLIAGRKFVCLHELETDGTELATCETDFC